MIADSTALTLADGRIVECGQTLRNLPEKRHVYAGRFDGRPAIVKVFLDRRRARVHFQRELDGLHAFHYAGIAAPEVLYAGSDGAGRPVIILARIGDAVALSTLWQGADFEQRSKLMRLMMNLLASHHIAGICQTDLHRDNFLVADGLVYSLDGDGVLAQAGPLDERRSLQNLALYFSQLDPGQDPMSLEFSAYYAQRRSWSASVVRARIPPLIDAARLYRWRKLRAQIYRDCTAVAHLKAPGRACRVTRSYESDLRPLLADLDAHCPSDPARRLKTGSTATVWRALAGDRSLVVKRYNVKDGLHGVMRALKESRASISWRNAHMLEMFGVATPVPVAFCIRRQSPLRPVGYFLAENVSGISLVDWIEKHRDQPEAIRRAAAMVGDLFSRLRRLQISHGDMKATNFILSDDRLIVLDLDSMRQHRFRLVFERVWRRDMARFAANWQDSPRVMEIMQEAIETARQAGPESLASTLKRWQNSAFM